MNENDNDLGIGALIDHNEEHPSGIPDFLRNQSNAVLPAVQPEFSTTVEPDGQVALTVEEQGYVNDDPDADLPHDVQAQQMLDQLPEQQVVHASSPEDTQADAGAFIQQSEIDEVQRDAAAGDHSQQLQDDNTPEGNLSHDPSTNQPVDPAEMRRDFFKDVNKFGKASGEGASALGRLGLRALRAAADGVLSSAKPQGGGKDDATLVYEAYTAMDSKHAEHTAGGAKANASKLRQVIAMGCMPTLSDPVAIGDRVVAIRQRMEDAELKPKALFAALVDTAREQLASDRELSDAEIEACLTKTKADKTLEKEWEAVYKKVEGLVTGENSHGLKDNSDKAMLIAKEIEEHIKNYKLEGTRQDRIDSLIENGYTRAQATAIVDKKITI